MSYTADIGLKGTRVRRLLRTVDAFDVYLGGGVAADVHLGILYQKGVAFDQLPNLLEHVIRDFYVHGSPGETFSQYWRRKLPGHKAEQAQPDLPTWRCTHCGHLHVAFDPPPFCPLCAALRSQFELGASTPAPAAESAAAPTAAKPERRARRAAHGVAAESPGETTGQTA